MMWYQSVQARESASRAMNYRRSFFITTCLAFGFAFLYIPILSMVVFSFNASKLVTVWDSANSPTLKWYYSLLHNEEILDAAWISLKVAVINASGAVILGTLAGIRPRALRAVPGALHPERHDHGASGHAGGDHRSFACCSCSSRWSS